ncbi:MAG: sensor histidine kinase [Chitinophagaceae bacterium]
MIEGVIDYSPTSMNSLREEVLKLNSLVNDLHLLALSDLQVLPCYFEELNLKKLISQIVDRFQRQAATKDIHLNVQFIEIEELQVRWDSRRIDQLVGNLIDNSLRHTDSPGKVFVTVQLKNPFAVSIDINDTAPGVSENDLKHLFDPLFRADTSRSKWTGGSGLGLSICQQITNSHHGLLKASHSELGGISMHLELPIDGDATT